VIRRRGRLGLKLNRHGAHRDWSGFSSESLIPSGAELFFERNQHVLNCDLCDRMMDCDWPARNHDNPEIRKIMVQTGLLQTMRESCFAIDGPDSGSDPLRERVVRWVQPIVRWALQVIRCRQRTVRRRQRIIRRRRRTIRRGQRFTRRTLPTFRRTLRTMG